MIESIYKDKIAIVFSVDNNYIDYFAVSLSTLKFYSSKNYSYDIIILYEHLQEHKIEKIISIYKDDNFNIRFFNISKYIKDMHKYLYICDHFSTSNYFRILIPKLLNSYNMAIYCDCDAIFFTDLGNIYNIDLGNNLLACVPDIEIQRNYYSKDNYSKKILFYLKNTLKLNNPLKYFNSGFLIFNIKKCLEFDFVDKNINVLKQIKPRYVDQCVINKVAENKVMFLDLKWNVENHVIFCNLDTLKLIPRDIFDEFLESHANPYFLHFTSGLKPWSHPHIPYADIWWHYARQTPFYEEILFNNISKINNNKPHGAIQRIKNQLSYKIGNSIIKAKNPIKAIFLPLIIIYLLISHKVQKIIYNVLIKINPNIKLAPLDQYADYNEALNFKKHLSYRLGNAFIKNPLTFIFKIKRIYREWKSER
ncbi:hypothetical protein C3I07_02470 [Campylobacter jejuni]|nr:hypothetical protein C3I07_02470 [Campylobacter jejuni]RTJ24239.1 hypothetical protein C3H86_02110 [Campylobacter jejuni]